jgi:hypothetical protein
VQERLGCLLLVEVEQLLHEERHVFSPEGSHGNAEVQLVADVTFGSAFTCSMTRPAPYSNRSDAMR